MDSALWVARAAAGALPDHSRLVCKVPAARRLIWTRVMADVACHAAVALRRGRRRLPRRAASGAHHRGRRRTRLRREAAIRRYEAITARTLSRRRIALYHALAMRGIEAGKTAMMRW